MLETAAGEDEGEVAEVVGVGVAEVAAEQDHGVVEEVAVAFFFGFEVGEEGVEGVELGAFDESELVDFFGVLTVVGKIVVVDGDAGDRGDVAALADEQGDESGAVGLQSEGKEVEEELHATDGVGFIGDVLGGAGVNVGFGFLHPVFGFVKTLFHLADGSKIFVELFAVGMADAAGEPFGVFADGVHDAAAFLEFAHLAVDFAGTAVEEKFGEDFGGSGFAGDHDAATGVALAAGVVGAEDEGGVAGFEADFFGDELVDGDGVAEAAEAGVFGGGEPGEFGGVSVASGLVGMGEAGEDGVLIAVLFKEAEVGGVAVGATGFGGDEVRGVKAEGVADGDHAFRRGGRAGGG